MLNDPPKAVEAIDDGLLAKHKVMNLVTELLAEKLNQVVGTHDDIVSTYMENATTDYVLGHGAQQVKDDIAEFIGATGVWA